MNPSGTMVGVDQTLSDVPQDGARAGASRLRVLQTLRQHPEGLGAQDLADAVGLHINTVRFHLDRLVADGVVARADEDRSEPGRPRLNYTVVADPGSQGDKRSYRLLASMLAGCISESVPNAAEVAREAGRTWGRYLVERPGPYRRTEEDEALGQLVQLLDDIGFAPEVAPYEHADEADREIRLHHCPFLEIADEHREVVCSAHLGLMQGALSEIRAPLEARRLEPFVQPSLCVATLTHASPRDTGESG